MFRIFCFALLLLPQLAFADFSLSRQNIYFGDVMIGFYERETVVLKNEGAKSISLRFRETCEEGLSYLNSSCKRTIGSGKFCFIDVYFEPINERESHCQIWITDSMDNMKVIKVKGNGVIQP